MTEELRDAIALELLPLLIEIACSEQPEGIKDIKELGKACAADCYAFADAFLAERG